MHDVYNVALSSVYKKSLPVVNTVTEADTTLAVFVLVGHMVLQVLQDWGLLSY